MKPNRSKTQRHQDSIYMESSLGSFAKAPHADLNPRQEILDNFKEISRIMTQSFLSHKKMQHRFGASGVAEETAAKVKLEAGQTNRMSNIMKKMHSPRNFQAPAQFLNQQSQSLSQMQKYTTSDMGKKERLSLCSSILEDPLGSKSFHGKSVRQDAGVSIEDYS